MPSIISTFEIIMLIFVINIVIWRGLFTPYGSSTKAIFNLYEKGSKA